MVGLALIHETWSYFSVRKDIRLEKHYLYLQVDQADQQDQGGQVRQEIQVHPTNNIVKTIPSDTVNLEYTHETECRDQMQAETKGLVSIIGKDEAKGRVCFN